jgi:mRNA interferase MazF
MNDQRGDIVLASFPFASGAGGSRRPVLIVQNDADNQRMSNTIVAQITSSLTQAKESTQLLIEVSTDEGKQSGLLRDSVVSCNNLATIHERRIQDLIGSLSAVTMARIDDCLKATLGLH